MADVHYSTIIRNDTNDTTTVAIPLPKKTVDRARHLLLSSLWLIEEEGTRFSFAMASAVVNNSKNSLIVKRLYRNLLRTAQPFVSSPDAPILTSLLQRTGIDDWDDDIDDDDDDHDLDYDGDDDENAGELTEAMLKQDYARDLTTSYADRVFPTKVSASTDDGAMTTATTYSARLSSTDSSTKQHHQLFRRLLREVMTGPAGYAKMVFPSHTDPTKLYRILQREFRNSDDDCVSKDFEFSVRKQMAFTALQELNKKLAYFDKLQQQQQRAASSLSSSFASTISPYQAALRVAPLSTKHPSSYLRPGTFLVAHPFLNDTVFSKTVICILDHEAMLPPPGETKENSSNDDKDDDNKDDEDDNDNSTNDTIHIQSRDSQSSDRHYKIPGQTYGLVINRISRHERTGETRSLKQVFQENMLPERLSESFGTTSVRYGGPVHVSLQMIHSLSAAQQDQLQASSDIGGTMIPEIMDDSGDSNIDDQTASAALYSDQATFFRGNIFKAIAAVEKGVIDREDVSFYVGASTWSPRQLAAEIAQGYWMPCRGPPEMVLHGICEHEQPTGSSSSNSNSNINNNNKGIDKTNGNDGSQKQRPLTDLWLSMLSACGEEEAKMAHLFYSEHQWDENGQACDAFEDSFDDLMF